MKYLIEMNAGILTETLNHFISAFSASWGNLQPSINWLIGILLSIEIVLLGLWWALSGGERLVEVIKKLLFLGFWMWIVTGFPELVDAFVNSLIEAGKIAGSASGGGPSLYNPSKILGYGLDITKPLGEQLRKSGFNIVNSLVVAFAYMMIVLAYIIIAWQVFFAVLEFYLLMALVSIFLPFGFLEKTRFLAEKSIAAVVSSGVKLMVLAFILSVGEPLIQGFKLPSGLWSLEEIWSVLLVSGGLLFWLGMLLMWLLGCLQGARA
ncbi:P-type conjugative transfer protein TrbL [Prosthecochloris sp. HL-130-GSB]|uniref:P-type conjugative transfer protein TrbL n=1 Tax=Prosthecochloris sp. HL-130-GSB TaxID=1974213 RepID=UPI000A1C0ECC|nr:P-type conjugative transfer protein TrbL [Prosthecochloris sp. HL-130-GSB]ARM30495.1 P-type conjugative transfer protein TrbL [Prosthecochloris sp. HL-130-GSB]